jgi:gas vesicle protein
MGQAAEERLSADIAGTRQELGRDLDALGDRVSPSQMMHRRKEATRSRMRSMRDKVMGTAHDTRHGVSSAGSSVGDTASGAADSVSSTAQGAVDTVERQTEGNPLAAGLIAFGAGWLVSSLLPASEKEAQAAQRMVEQAKEHGQPVMEEAKSVGQEMGQNLKESAQQAAEEVKGTAQESTQNVRQEGQSSAQHVQEDVRARTQQ